MLINSQEEAKLFIRETFYFNGILEFEQEILLHNYLTYQQKTKYLTNGACLGLASLFTKYILKYPLEQESFNTFKYFCASHSGVYYITFWMKEQDIIFDKIRKCKKFGYQHAPQNILFNKYNNFIAVEKKTFAIEREPDQIKFNYYKDFFYIKNMIIYNSTQPHSLDKTCLANITNINYKWVLEICLYSYENYEKIAFKAINLIYQRLIHFTGNTKHYLMQLRFPTHIICISYYRDKNNNIIIHFYDPNIGVIKYKKNAHIFSFNNSNKEYIYQLLRSFLILYNQQPGYYFYIFNYYKEKQTI